MATAVVEAVAAPAAPTPAPTPTADPPEEEIALARDRDPCVLVPCHATVLRTALLVVGWCCWDAPLSSASATAICSLSHCTRAGGTVVCRRCLREYGVFANRLAPGGALVVTVR